MQGKLSDQISMLIKIVCSVVEGCCGSSCEVNYWSRSWRKFEAFGTKNSTQIYNISFKILEKCKEIQFCSFSRVFWNKFTQFSMELRKFEAFRTKNPTQIHNFSLESPKTKFCSVFEGFCGNFWEFKSILAQFSNKRKKRNYMKEIWSFLNRKLYGKLQFSITILQKHKKILFCSLKLFPKLHEKNFPF